MKKIISTFLAFCLLTGMLSVLTGCSGSYPFEKGATTEATVKTGKDTKIGNSAKTGWGASDS